jgi:hypothetical protein
VTTYDEPALGFDSLGTETIELVPANLPALDMRMTELSTRVFSGIGGSHGRCGAQRGSRTAT